MNKQTKQLRSESKLMKPSIIIGKNGLTDNAVENIKNEFKKSRLVKIRILPSLIENKNKKEIVAEILEKTNSKLVDFVGFTVTLTK